MYKIHVNDNKAGGGVFWHFVEVPKARPFTIEGFEDYEFFVHRPYKGEGRLRGSGWVVSEASTGRRITTYEWQTQTEAKAQAKERLDDVGRKRFAEAVELHLKEMETEVRS